MIDELWCAMPSQCLDCGKEWVAVFPLAAADIECPECGSDNTVRGFDDDEKA
jgi:Zn finger protein HypA/HybF involved in hydrogenase expression